MSMANSTNTDVKVSVAMITYNHERFISQAIESVLMQQTDFAVELVIGEDCSTDGTRAIVCEYAERHPSRVRLLLPEHNLGMMPNFIATLGACRGQYIALLEGDDYWTEPLKLQKQVDFLESHPECVICFHDVQILYEDASRPSVRFSPPEQKQLYVLEDVLKSTVTQTASLVFRNGLMASLPDWFHRAPLGDWALNVLLAEHGKIGYLSEVMSVWRNHGGSVWVGIPECKQLRQKLQMYELFDAHFERRYAATLEPPIAACHYGLALDCWLNGQREEQAHWMNLILEKFPKVTGALFTKVLVSAHEVEASCGYRTAEEAVNWTCDAVRTQPGGNSWAKKLRGEWYAGCAYKAYQRNDAAAVRRASRYAVRNDWRILKNRGFVSRWLSAMIGRRTWTALRRSASVDSAQSDGRPNCRQVTK